MAQQQSTSAKIVLVLTAVVLCSSLASMGQSLMTVRHAEHQDVSAPLRDLIKQARPARFAKHEAEPVRRIPVPEGLAALSEDPVRQQTVIPGTPAINSSFEGLGNNQYGFAVQYAPPDTNGAVGATQYVQWVNVNFAIFDKTTHALVAGPTAGNTLWSGFGGGCEVNNDGDPIVLYDKAAQRWVFSQFSVSSTPYLQCIAVSTSSDASGTYNRYSFKYNDFDDYPKMGVWPDAYYETFNMFVGGVTFAGADACAYDRAAMIAGTKATQVCFQQPTSVGGLLPSDVDGSTPPPTGSPNYMLYYGTNVLNLYKFHVDFATPANSTLTGPTAINVAAFTPLCNGGTCVPQPGTTQKLDSLADRLMYRLAYRNFGTHESLVVNHSVKVSTGGGGVRWYEIQNPSGTPTVAQQGTFAPDASYRWMGSIAMDQAGDIALGYSKSSSSIHPSIAYTGRVPTDPAGTMEAEVTVVSGTGSQTSGLNRWGDYSAMQIDPVDDCTFWYTQEYIQTNGSFNWNTRIVNFKFPNCGSGGAPQASLTPSSLKFGKMLIGQTSGSKTVTLANNGTGTLDISNVSVTGDFVIQNNPCGSQVLAGQDCVVTLAFTPTAKNTRTGVLTFTDNAGTGTQTVPLSGTGVSLSLSPATLPFGTVTVGQTSNPQAVTVTNVSNAIVSISSISIGGTNASDFIIASKTCGSTVGAGGNCQINIEFKPSGTGKRFGKLNVFNNGGGSPAQTPLNGTGQ